MNMGEGNNTKEPDPNNYLEHWLEYYRAATLSLLLVLFGGAVAFGIYLYTGPGTEHLALKTVAVLILFGSFLPYILWAENWRCPRCGKHFFRKGIRYFKGLKKCVHCGFEMTKISEPPLRLLLKHWKMNRRVSGRNAPK